MSEDSYVPMKAKEIAVLLNVPKNEYNNLVQVLKKLEDEYKIQKSGKNKYSLIDNKKFIEVYEQYYPTFKWRKNSNIYKLYQASLAGEIKEIKKEIIFEDENLEAYIKGDRAYIKFMMKPQRQLIYALKSRKWWWNTYENAWSTYLDRIDKEWISSISERYQKYL